MLSLTRNYCKVWLIFIGAYANTQVQVTTALPCAGPRVRIMQHRVASQESRAAPARSIRLCPPPQTTPVCAISPTIRSITTRQSMLCVAISLSGTWWNRSSSSTRALRLYFRFDNWADFFTKPFIQRKSVPKFFAMRDSLMNVPTHERHS